MKPRGSEQLVYREDPYGGLKLDVTRLGQCCFCNNLLLKSDFKNFRQKCQISTI